MDPFKGVGDVGLLNQSKRPEVFFVHILFASIPFAKKCPLICVKIMVDLK